MDNDNSRPPRHGLSLFFITWFKRPQLVVKPFVSKEEQYIGFELTNCGRSRLSDISVSAEIEDIVSTDNPLPLIRKGNLVYIVSNLHSKKSANYFLCGKHPSGKALTNIPLLKATKKILEKKQSTVILTVE